MQNPVKTPQTFAKFLKFSKTFQDGHFFGVRSRLRIKVREDQDCSSRTFGYGNILYLRFEIAYIRKHSNDAIKSVRLENALETLITLLTSKDRL